MTGIGPDVTGRVIVVTGGASGIGAAVVAGFEKLGAHVVVADLQGDPVVDVTDRDSVRGLARFVEREYGRCDYLVTCAGAVVAGPPDSFDDTQWDLLFEVNVKGIWRAVDALLPLMREGASILTVTSGAGLRPSTDLSAYAATKAAAIAYTRALAVDLAPRGIRANSIAPGVVDTPMHRAAQLQRGAESAAASSSHRNYLVKRDGTAAEIASAVIALATNAYATGSTLAVDGGRTLH